MLATPLEFPQKYHFCVNIHQFRVFYLEPSAPELNIATNIMEISIFVRRLHEIARSFLALFTHLDRAGEKCCACADGIRGIGLGLGTLKYPKTCALTCCDSLESCSGIQTGGLGGSPQPYGPAGEIFLIMAIFTVKIAKIVLHSSAIRPIFSTNLPSNTNVRKHHWPVGSTSEMLADWTMLARCAEEVGLDLWAENRRAIFS